MPHAHIDDLLRQAIEQLERKVEQVNAAGAQAFQHNDYHGVQSAAQHGQRLQKLVHNLKESRNEWTVLCSELPVEKRVECSPKDENPAARDDTPTRADVRIRVRMQTKSAVATGWYWSDQIEILAGSTVRAEELESIPDAAKQLRQKLRRRGALVPTDDLTVLLLKENVKFTSPSAASNFVAGYNSNGRKEWVVEETGQTINEYEGKLSQNG